MFVSEQHVECIGLCPGGHARTVSAAAWAAPNTPSNIYVQVPPNAVPTRPVPLPMHVPHPPAPLTAHAPHSPSPHLHLTAGAVTSAPAHTAEDAAEIAAMQAMTMPGDAPKQIRIRAAADATAALQAVGAAPLKDRFWDCSCAKTGTTKTPAGSSPWACACSLAKDSAPAAQQQPTPAKAEQPKPAETKPAPQQQPKADAPKPAAPKAEAPKVVKAVVVQAPKPVEKKEAPKPQEQPAPKPQEAPLKEAPKPAPVAEQPKAIAPQQPAPVVQQPTPVVQQLQPAQQQFPEQNLATETPAAGNFMLCVGRGM